MTMRRCDIVGRAKKLRELLDAESKTSPRKPKAGFDFDPSDTSAFIARAKWQLKHMPRGLTESAELLGEIRGTLIGSGLYETAELQHI
jgi:hypothetical protein